MAKLVKTIARVGVIGGLLVAGAVVIAGPHRVGALLTQTRHTINNKIDQNITDPVALRAQLRDLEAQLPKKIADVRGDMAEVREQLSQLNRERSVAEKVVAFAERDLSQLEDALARTEATQIEHASTNSGRRIVVIFKNERLSPEEARIRYQDVSNTRAAYSSRLTDYARDIGYLSKQENRLVSLMTKLENERQQFQAQLWDLDRQIDEIARNERMIVIMEKRQASFSELDRYEGASLDHVQGKLAEIRARQEAHLDAIASSTERTSYEDLARSEVDFESLGQPQLPAPVRADQGEVEIHAQPEASSPMALRN